MNCNVTELKNHNFELKKRVSEYLELIFNNSTDLFLNDQVLNRFLWTVTEDSDSGIRVKYLGQPYWSKNAIIHYQKQNSGRKSKNFKDLRHDHSVPKVIIFNKIKDLVNNNSNFKASEILEIFNKYSHAVVITKHEDNRLKQEGLNQKMPEDFNILTRYSLANIEVIDVTGCDLKKLQFDKSL